MNAFNIFCQRHHLRLMHKAVRGLVNISFLFDFISKSNVQGKLLCHQLPRATASDHLFGRKSRSKHLRNHHSIRSHCPKSRPKFRQIPRSVDARSFYRTKSSELKCPLYISDVSEVIFIHTHILRRNSWFLIESFRNIRCFKSVIFNDVRNTSRTFPKFHMKLLGAYFGEFRGLLILVPGFTRDISDVYKGWFRGLF
jgi:hypothetical protein